MSSNWFNLAGFDGDLELGELPRQILKVTNVDQNWTNMHNLEFTTIFKLVVTMQQSGN